jgi:hypothetical protein
VLNAIFMRRWCCWGFKPISMPMLLLSDADAVINAV